MRKIFYILPVLIFTLISCMEDREISGGPEEGLLNITFTVNLPGAKDMLQTRAWKETDIDESKNLLISNMYVLLFDEAGFISRHKASQGSGYGEFTVLLPASSTKRILHFICNYDKWDEFSDEAMLNMNEATVLANMYVEYPRVAYCSREVVSNITSTTTLSPTLIRNVAKISLTNNSASGMDESHLEDVSFAIGNYYNRGTVTNFNTTTGEFDENSILEAKGADLCGITEDEDFVPATENGSEGISLLAYERFNSNPNRDDHLYIIIRGTYYLNGVQQPGTRYYKIDIVEFRSEVLYDIQRNRQYNLTINQVLSEGYTTLEEAVNSLALNNIATSVMQSYNSISDGDDILNLEYVNKLFVDAADPDPAVADFAVRYSYVDAVTGATNNSGVQMDWGTKDTDRPAIGKVDPLPNRKIPGASGLEEGYVDRVSGKLVSSLPASGVAESYIRIFKNNLSRTLILRLRQPFSFENVNINPLVAGRNTGVPVTVSFDIPATLEDQLPFQVYVYAPMLAPDTGSKVYYEDLGTTFRYRYTVTATGTHSLGFKTGSTHGAGEIRIVSDLFQEESVQFTRQ